MEKFDNSVYRIILDLPIYTGTEFLKGEIGANSSKGRDFKSKIFFIIHALEENKNEL